MSEQNKITDNIDESFLLGMNKMIDNRIDSRVLELTSIIKKNLLLENKPFLTIDDFSQITGLKKTTIYQYCSLSKIGYYRPTGKHTFFTWDNVREFILNEQCHHRANSEIRRKAKSEFIRKISK